jgi:hypothetical protein
MGSLTDANIKAWQDATGIKPATGESAEVLQYMSDTAFRLIKVIERERSGIRDGDGFWHGSDVIGGIAWDLVRIIEEYSRVTAPVPLAGEVRINGLTLAQTLATPGGRVSSLEVHEAFGRAREQKARADYDAIFGAVDLGAVDDAGIPW